MAEALSKANQEHSSGGASGVAKTTLLNENTAMLLRFLPVLNLVMCRL